MPQKLTAFPQVEIRIAGGTDTLLLVKYFEWASFVNCGYIIRCKLMDANYETLRKFIQGTSNTEKYLEDGRKKPIEIKFRLKWNDELRTDERIAYLTDMHGNGGGQKSIIEFVGIDPPSFLLNAGLADGKIYKGKVSSVIEQVVKEYAPGITVDVTKTNDSDENRWPMMRMDPQSFIMSLLDWSSSITPQKSRWIVSSKDKKISIKEEADLKGEYLGEFSVADNSLISRDVARWDLEMNNFISAFQTNLTTAGISATSGKWIDQQTAKKEAIVKDETTGSKVNVQPLDKQRAFTKPSDKKWATFIQAIPENSAGDLGIEYKDYIDGTARQTFMNMLAMTMKIAVKIQGEPKLDNSEKLGTSTCTLVWYDLESKQYFLHGKWIVYGFRHIYKGDDWSTILYLYRIDHDSASKKI